MSTAHPALASRCRRKHISISVRTGWQSWGSAERAIRGIALGRKNYLFVGSQAGGKAAAIAYTLIETAKLNGIDPQGWLADTLARIPDYKITKVDDLLPWNHKNRHTLKDAA